jgi:hypothetical protein
MQSLKKVGRDTSFDAPSFTCGFNQVAFRMSKIERGFTKFWAIHPCFIFLFGWYMSMYISHNT